MNEGGGAVRAEAAARRPGLPADAVGGVRPTLVFAPQNQDEAAAVIEECAREKRALGFAGGRTDIELGASPTRLDAVVETGGLMRILEHAPSDQIVVAEAGVTIAALQRRLSEHGQRLALDPVRPELATVGGVVAANAWGELRTRYGSVRDLLIGVSFLRADGASARGGGKVVKNVAGFDLPKLMVGSLGTLGMITTATFRLHPVPEARCAVLVRACTAGEVRVLMDGMRESALEPAAVIALGTSPAGRFDVAVRFEGFSKGVAEQRDRFMARAGARVETCDEGAVAELAARHDAARDSGSLRVRLAAPRDAFEIVVREALVSIGSVLSSPRLVAYPTLGLARIGGDFESADGKPAPAAVLPALARAREAVGRLGGSLVVGALPDAIRGRFDPWGSPPASFGVMESMKDRFDPERRLAPGRFVGGL